MDYVNYYPGDDYLDVLALDVYGRDFNQTYYDGLQALSKGKPLVLGEVGNPPALDILEQQPGWAFYVIWVGMVRNTPKKEYQLLVVAPNVLHMDDSAYIERIAPFRKVCGLPPLEQILAQKSKPEFTGFWIFDEDSSILDDWGAGFLPYKLNISQKENTLSIEKTTIVEWGDDQVRAEPLIIDSQEYETVSPRFNSPLFTKTHWSETGDTLIVETRTTIAWGEGSAEIRTREAWQVKDGDQVLSIHQQSKSPWRERNITAVYRKF